MINITMEEKYYTINEVAELLKVAYLTVYRWIRGGKLKAVKIQKQYRIRQSDLNEFIKIYNTNNGTIN